MPRSPVRNHQAMETAMKMVIGRSVLFTAAWAALLMPSVYAGDTTARIMHLPPAHSSVSASLSRPHDSEIVIAQYQSAPRPSDQYRGGLPSVEVPRQYVPSDPDVSFIARYKSASEVRHQRDNFYQQFLKTRRSSAYTQYKKYDQALELKRDKCNEQDRIRRTTNPNYRSVYCH